MSRCAALALWPAVLALSGCATEVKNLKIDVDPALRTSVVLNTTEPVNQQAVLAGEDAIRAYRERAAACGGAETHYEAGDRIAFSVRTGQIEPDALDEMLACWMPGGPIKVIKNLTENAFGRTYEYKVLTTLGPSDDLAGPDFRIRMPGDKIAALPCEGEDCRYFTIRSEPADHQQLRFRITPVVSKAQFDRGQCQPFDCAELKSAKHPQIGVRSSQSKIGIEEILGGIGLLFGSGFLVGLVRMMQRRRRTSPPS